MGNAQSNTLHEAAANNDLPKAQSLIRDDHRDVNEVDKDGWTPLHFAAYGGSLQVLNELLSYGADATVADKGGRTPLHLAALRGNKEVAETLLNVRSVHVDARDENGMTSLHKAATQGHVGVVEVLIAKLADVNARLKDGTTPVHLAAWKGHDSVLKLLLVKGGNFRAAKDDGQTPLHEAAEEGHKEVVQLLLSLGANPQLVDKDGNTPAALAIKNHHPQIAALITSGPTYSLTEPRLPVTATPAPSPAVSGLDVSSYEAWRQKQAAQAPSAPPMPMPEVFFSAEDLAKGPALPGGYPSLTATAPPAGDKSWWDSKLSKPEGANNIVPFPKGTINSAAAAPAGGASALAPLPTSEAQVNASWWDAALNKEPKEGVPTVGEAAVKAALGAAPSVPQPGHPAYGQYTLSSEASLNNSWWAANLGKDLGSNPTVVIPPSVTAAFEQAGQSPVQVAAGVELPRAVPGEKPKPKPGSREEFEANVLKNAQGLVRFIQSKLPKDNKEQETRKKEEELKRAQAEAARKQAELAKDASEWGRPAATTSWGGVPESKVPATEKYDLEPFDDDDYGESAPTPVEAPAPKAVSWREQAALRKKLAELELAADQQEGWVRGATKAEAKAVQEHRAKMKKQEEEIVALKRQLEAMTVAPPAKSSVPPEYICPITQAVMQEPVVAADGYTYERGAILTWLQSGQTVSPMTGQPLPHPGLTPNNTLRSAIYAFQAQAH